MNRLHNRAPAALALIAVAASAALAGCGSNTESEPQITTTGPSSPPSGTPSPSSSSAADAEAVDLKTHDSALGEIVVDGQGKTLYYYTKDVKDSGTSSCTGGCLEAWPIAVAAGDKPAADPTVTGTVGTIDSPDGRKQLTLNGMPLYYYAEDTLPGDVLGQGVNDVWYVVEPDGEMVTSAPASK
jgi:predicted lipoprotein with Yx(FWY)xxD motif